MTENTWIRVEDGILTVPVNYNLEDIEQVRIGEPGKHAVKTFYHTRKPENGVLSVLTNADPKDIMRVNVCKRVDAKKPGKYKVKTFFRSNSEELVYYLLDIINADINKRCVKDGVFEDDGSEVTKVEKDLIKHIFDWCSANGIHDFDMDLDNKED